MAPLKQEEQMRDKLENRSLQPTPESWAILANRLDTEEKDKNKSKVRFLCFGFGIAASIVGILLVTALYFNNKPIENNIPVIVESDTKEIEKVSNDINDFQLKSDEVAVEEQSSDTNATNDNISKSNQSRIVSQNSELKTGSSEQEAVAQIEKMPNFETFEMISKVNKAPLTFEEQKIQDVVAQINELKSNGNTVTDTEIDSLLKKAQKGILSNRIYNETTRTVDANALLQDVETDLQQSFRSKVFEALQSGYESVRTAVAERNN